MATFRKARELLIASFDDGDISEDEFLLLSGANNSKNLDYPYQNYEHFDLEGLDESECLVEKGHTYSCRSNGAAWFV